MRRALIGLLAWPALAQAQAPDAPVTVEGGQVTGSTDGAVTSFKGIPFAAPPVGAMRWRAPQPVVAWSGVRAATRFGADCMQKPFPSDAAPLGTDPAEDCLTVNVWRPSKPGHYPVAVWIYGGGFVNGGSSPAVYDGSAFARAGVVFVSFNYRVGRFGFFAHPALSAAAEGPLGNYTLLDQIAALQWVKRNIAGFGGEANRVTLMGESAGGASVLYLMAAPAARGLFQQAFVMSGGGRTLIGDMPLRSADPSAPSAESVGLTFASRAGVAGQDADTLARLRALPADVVRGNLNLADRENASGPTFSGPIVDGTTIPTSTEAAIRSGAAAPVPMLIGTTEADIGFHSAKTKEELFAGFGQGAVAVRAAYDPQGSGVLETVATQASRDRLMTEPARFVAGQMVRAGKPAWLYRYGYVAESKRAEWTEGTPHATDIPFFFDTVAAKYGAALTKRDAAAAAIANRYVVNFVRTGDPNGAGLPLWRRFVPEQDDIALFGPDGSARTTVDPLKPRLDAIQAAADGQNRLATP